MASERDRKLIDLILQSGLATREQVAQCLIERPVDSPSDIAQSLVDRSIITQAQAERVRAAADSPLAGLHLPQIDGYEFLEELGSGSMGTVYKGRQVSMNRPVAIKVLPPEMTRNADFVQRFITEARTAGKLNHPNIVQGIDVGRAPDGSHYFIMEFVEGETIQQVLQKEGKITEHRALPIIRDIASALQNASSNGLIHRDVKPENIILSTSGVAKLADLGLAAPVDQLSREGSRVEGTPYYIAPEIVRGDREIDVRADIYSLGATFFHMVTGTVPFEGPSAAVVMAKHLSDRFPAARDRQPSVSMATNRVIAKMTARNKSERYPSAEALIADLDRVIRGDVPATPLPAARPARAQVSERPVTVRRPRSTSPTGVIAIVAGVVGLLVIALIAMNAGRTSPQQPPVISGKQQPPPPQPGPANPPKPPEPRTDREKPAREALEAARTCQQQHPTDFDAIQKAYEVVTKEYSETTSAPIAKTALQQLELARRTAQANAAVAKANEQAPQLARERKFGQAITLYKQVVGQYPNTTASAEAQSRLDALIAKAKEEYAQESLRANELIRQDKLKEALVIFTDAAGWSIDEVTADARVRSDALKDRLAKLATEQDAARKRLREQLRSKLDAAIPARNYQAAIAAISELLKSADDPEKPILTTLLDDMQQLAALRAKLIERIKAQPGTIGLSAKGAIGKAVGAADDGVSIKAENIQMQVPWSDLVGAQHCRLASEAIGTQNGPDLLAVALLCAWEGEYRMADQRLASAAAAGADTAKTAVRLLKIRFDAEKREIDNRLAAIRKAVNDAKYVEALAALDDLEKTFAKSDYFQAIQKDIAALRETCEQHRLPCPQCQGVGTVRCNRCAADGQIRVRKKCSECDGTGTVRAGFVLETCPRCRGRGTVVVDERCPDCKGTGRAPCPTCKGQKFIYR